jgi:dephospho-CoA kinase
MIKIAVVGDIGSGKSFIAKQFGFPVFNADKEINKIYKNNNNCFKSLKNQLPKYIYSFPIKKNELGKAILDNQNNLKKIVKIVHPLVRDGMNSFLNKNKNKKFLVLDVPLLLENKLNKKNFILIFVSAKKKEIQKRLRKRPSYNPKIFNRLKKLQLPLELKKKKSNFVIKNNFKIKSVRKSVKVLKNKILNI